MLVMVADKEERKGANGDCIRNKVGITEIPKITKIKVRKSNNVVKLNIRELNQEIMIE